MGADRAPNIGIGFRDRADPRKLVETGPDRQHRRDAGGAGPRDDRIALLGEIREIEMAMAVDQHHSRSIPLAVIARSAATKQSRWVERGWARVLRCARNDTPVGDYPPAASAS